MCSYTCCQFNCVTHKPVLVFTAPTKARVQPTADIENQAKSSDEQASNGMILIVVHNLLIK